MNGFTLVDGIVLAVIALSAVLAYARGFVREALSITGWVAAALAGFYFAPMLEPLMREVPVLQRPPRHQLRARHPRGLRRRLRGGARSSSRW